MQRKLATIMVGDFVGSTSAMETDEEGAITRIDTVLETVRTVVQRHDGRVFGTAGDALLAEFASPVNALRSAIEARAEIAALPGASGGDMRFGLHLADVVVVGSDLRGDGVNIAARIEASAPPGAIDVSGLLYDQVRRVSPCGFEDIGERRLRGFWSRSGSTGSPNWWTATSISSLQRAPPPAPPSLPGPTRSR